MKKILSVILVFVFCITLALSFAACKDNAEENGPIDIGLTGNEMTAFNKTNDVWTYPENYEGRTITIKGIYSEGVLKGGGDEVHNFVGVYDGCCSWAYLTFVWDGELPSRNTIVTVTGTVHTRKLDKDGKAISYAELSALEVSF